MPKTPAEIEALKQSWKHDPCWDIETEEGFEDHVEELLNFRRQTESEWKAAAIERESARADFVREQTGVTDADIVSALNTWNEIERMVSSQDRYLPEIGELSEQVKIELMQAQIRATLLQAAQLKRIADVLEDIEDGDSLVRSARRWGSEQ